MRILIILFLALTLASCKEEVKPDYLIDEDVYIDLLIELQIVKSYSYLDPSLPTDSARMDILNAYGISKDDFLKSHEYFQQGGAEQIFRLDKAIERIKAIEDSLFRVKTDSLGSRN